MKNKKGSSAVMLAIVFVALTASIASAIGISRELAVKSECETFGRLWTKAVLSEYDRHLLEDYKIMAYFGNEAEVKKRIDGYMDYSTGGKLGIRIGGSTAELSGYQLAEPQNFKAALKLAYSSSLIDAVLNGNGRAEKDDEPDQDGDFGSRKVGNPLVTDTLPSGGIRNTIDIDALIEKAKSGGIISGLTEAAGSAAAEVGFIEAHFGNYVTTPTEKDCYFRNEWEYILTGNLSDEENYESCKRKLFLLRNAMNLVSIYKDPDRAEIVNAVAAMITPGPLMPATQAVIAEAWAVYETEKDLETLYDNGRVPLIKTGDEWQTSLGDIIESDEIKGKLDEESQELMNENLTEIKNIEGINDVKGKIVEGMTYDDYLMAMIMTMNDNVRLLRIMDLVQINMKFRYYRDFNMQEYYTGVRFTIKANGRDYEFEDEYR